MALRDENLGVVSSVQLTSCVIFDKSHNLSVVHMVRAVSVNQSPREESV